MTHEPDPLAAALGAALRGEQDGADPGETRAREAFRAARATEGLAARRTRRRDDWRPVPVRGRWRGSLRTTAFGVAATVLLGGVAVAASGTLDPAAPAPAPAPVPAPESSEAPEVSHSASADPTVVAEVPFRPRGGVADRSRDVPDGAAGRKGSKKGRSEGGGAVKNKAAAQGKGPGPANRAQAKEQKL